jgi:hypothetical protein
MSIHDYDRFKADQMMSRAVAQECSSQSGKYRDVIAKSFAVVDNVLQTNSFRRYQLPDKHQKRCVCGRTLGEHSFNEWRCPNAQYGESGGEMYLNSSFAESKPTCQAIIPTNSIATEGCACGKPAVEDTEMCQKHLEDFNG